MGQKTERAHLTALVLVVHLKRAHLTALVMDLWRKKESRSALNWASSFLLERKKCLVPQTAEC